MKKVQSILFICSVLLLTNSIAKGQNNTLYVVDSVAYFYVSPYDKNEMFLYDDEIASSRVIIDSVEINNLGYQQDTVIFIVTNEMLKRPIEYKRIPNFKLFRLKNGLRYVKNFEKPYSGPFIDYNINGTIKRTGNIKNGVIEGLVKEYDKKGRIRFEKEYQGEAYTDYFTEYWPNGNVRYKGIKKESQVDVSKYTSNGSLIIEYYVKDELGSHTKFSKSQKKYLKKLITLFPKSKFNNKLNYKTFVNKTDGGEWLCNPKSYDTYFRLGIELFYCGEIENAILMLDSAITLEPYDFDSRICRLYSIIYKYEYPNYVSIKELNEDYSPTINRNSILTETDLTKICLDIQELKNNGYSNIVEYMDEDEYGNPFIYYVNIKKAEEIYCKKINAP